MTLIFRLFKKVAYFDIFNLKNDTINSDMGEIDFMEDNEFHIKSRQLLGAPTTPSMVTFLLKTGIAKNEKNALFILIGFIIFVVILTVYLANILLGSPTGPQYVEDRFGNKYTPEEYVEQLKRGNDPLSSNFVPPNAR